MSVSEDDPITLDMIDKHHPIKRVIFAVIGLAVMIGVVWNLWPGIWPVTLVTPFFALIVAGGLGVGGTVFMSAVFGDNTVMRFDRDHISLQRSNPWRQRTEIIAPDQIAGVIVHTNDWDSRDDTFEVRILFTNGDCVRGADFTNRATAENQAATLRDLIGKL